MWLNVYVCRTSYDVCLFVKDFVINTYAMNVCTKCVHLWAVQIMKTKYLLISTWDIIFILHTENICKKPYASVYSTSGWCENILFLVCPEFCRFPSPPIMPPYNLFPSSKIFPTHFCPLVIIVSAIFYICIKDFTMKRCAIILSHLEVRGVTCIIESMDSYLQLNYTVYN